MRILSLPNFIHRENISPAAVDVLARSSLMTETLSGPLPHRA